MSCNGFPEGLHVLVDDAKHMEGMDIICRTADGAQALLAGLQMPIGVLYMDHDLGPGKDGYDVLKTYFEYCDQNGDSPMFWPRVIQFVTMNPHGRDRMAGLIKDRGYTKEAGSPNWRRPER